MDTIGLADFARNEMPCCDLAIHHSDLDIEDLGRLLHVEGLWKVSD
ncbi:hypothetical protein [Sagittula sp.]